MSATSTVNVVQQKLPCSDQSHVAAALMNWRATVLEQSQQRASSAARCRPAIAIQNLDAVQDIRYLDALQTRLAVVSKRRRQLYPQRQQHEHG